MISIHRTSQDDLGNKCAVSKDRRYINIALKIAMPLRRVILWRYSVK